MIKTLESFFLGISFNEIVKITIYSPRSNAKYQKITGRLIKIKEQVVLQLSQFTQQQVFHRNISSTEYHHVLTAFLTTDYQKALVQTALQTFDLYVNNDKVKIVENKQEKQKKLVSYEHDRVKNYLLPQNTVIPPLIDLGILSSDGQVIKGKNDKYKQINRFLEMIDDVLSELGNEVLHIVDFGCGKAYLTFVVYYFLTVIKKRSVVMVGLDLKEDVIHKCNEAKRKYGYTNLHFQVGDIKNYLPTQKIDMVICLHACDTATDYALYNAIKWQSKVILAVPCCQHEVNKQIKDSEYRILTKHGIVKERFSALMTDVIRGNLLELAGYDVQLLEFVDFTHTPKNLLIRAIKKPNKRKNNKKREDEVTILLKTYQIEPLLYRLLKD